MEELSRRGFIGAMGMVGASVALAGPVVNIAKAEEVDATEAADAPDSSDPVSFDGMAMNSDDLLEQVLAEAETNGDVTLPDGSVVPEVYVRLRNRLNRIYKGVGNDVDEHSWEWLMYAWSEEDAQHELEMPMLKLFNAYDYAVASGRTEAECAEILEDMSHRNMLYRVHRSGQNYYAILPFINGFCEFMELKAYFTQGNPGVVDLCKQGMSCADASLNDYSATFPPFRSYPIGKDVIAEDEFAPYMDWRALIERNDKFVLSPCQCRSSEAAFGIDYPENQPLETCLSMGEMAEFMGENGLGREITKDEALAIYQDIIDRGMVVETVMSADADIMCACHSTSCGILGNFKKTAGLQVNAGRNYNAYHLEYDADKCISCGACVKRCPMEAISFDENNKCVHSDVCVRCGQCVRVCPADARILVANPDYPELPNDYIDALQFVAKDRMARGMIKDFTGTEIDASDSGISASGSASSSSASASASASTSASASVSASGSGSSTSSK